MILLGLPVGSTKVSYTEMTVPATHLATWELDLKPKPPKTGVEGLKFQPRTHIAMGGSVVATHHSQKSWILIHNPPSAGFFFSICNPPQCHEDAGMGCTFNLGRSQIKDH